MAKKEEIQDIHGRIEDRDIVEEMQTSYIDYAMSVIVGRALPDVRDGLKPVHRRILYSMSELNLSYDKPYRKSARIVGDTMGKYHPHGDSSIYDAMVRLAQDFSTRYPLVDGHGNFGSIDGDSQAAMRYTEAKMTKMTGEMLRDISKETVDYAPNFDETLKEPVVLPSRFPNLLVNGSNGIAVGMATNIPPHNLREVVDAIIALIENPNIEINDLIKYVKGPDFPTGGIIMGKTGIYNAYTTGRGRIKLRSKTHIEEISKKRQRIVVTEIPYMVNKAKMVEKIADLVRDKKVVGISDIRDESDRNGIRVAIDLRKDVNASIILNQLYKYTQLQDTFSVINLALVDNQPKVLNLKEILVHYLNHQKDIIVRRTEYDLKKAKARAHIVEGLLIALDNIDEIIKIIRASYNDAEEKLMERFDLSEVQAKAIVDMRLRRLQGLEREKLENEYAELLKTIEYLESVLASDELVMSIIKEELSEIKDKYGDERRTAFEVDDEDFDMEDLIEEEDIVVTITHVGYVKRLPASTYKTQKRGGKGVTALSTRENDFVKHLFFTTTHHYIMFFTNKGKVYRLKGYEIPDASRIAKGTAIVNLLALDPGEKITAVIPIKEFKDDEYLVMATRNGVFKKTSLTEYDSSRKNGIVAINLAEDDELIGVSLTDGNQNIILGTHKGLAIKFNEADVRAIGRVSKGVKGISLKDDDYLIGMDIATDNAYVLSVTEKGYGKITKTNLYPTQGRAGKGVLNYKLTKKTGALSGMCVIEKEKDDIMVISIDGTVIRIDTSGISQMGRSTSGVKVMTLDEDVNISTIAKVPSQDEEIDDPDEE
ncbi:DNA gyrase subunit A [Anaerofustis stercorihominis]|uniref:DNA gyrase subunit A n=1 Tax=Anaerofustis stercorihominis DSM 17244 TaxID=445971 RepID=B1C9C4_9FIRM|nr:DNA gyrase subunit A [Anaerofustis stercorihominis]EDS72288.1 DNA gyrase, A subunit [Anaerofustis stercorihominis DSM 17244]MCQ4795114.1 DNA gyrase subunit A [Anaerofustis stercorihominis]